MKNLLSKARPFMVSHIVNGQRIKYFVHALQKDEAIERAKDKGFQPNGNRTSVHVLKSKITFNN